MLLFAAGGDGGSGPGDRILETREVFGGDGEAEPVARNPLGQLLDPRDLRGRGAAQVPGLQQFTDA
ncbi:hypothetical protein D3C83_260840 [compost metagenome]